MSRSVYQDLDECAPVLPCHRRGVELVGGEVVEMSMDDATPAGGTILENAIPPHTFYGYDPQTGLPG